jgi:hypothetical protein
MTGDEEQISMNTQHACYIRAARRLATAALLAAALPLGGCASYQKAALSAAETPGVPASLSPEAEAKLGIHVTGLHLSAHGYVIDLRYRVFDKDKAGPLLDSKKKVYLVDEGHHAKLGIPESPVIGAMRQTSRNHVVYTDRDYFILFVNPGRAVRPGDVLKLAVDDSTIADLKVQ